MTLIEFLWNAAVPSKPTIYGYYATFLGIKCSYLPIIVGG